MVSPDGKGRVGLSTAPTSPVTMKTKNPARSHRPLTLLGIPFLLSPAGIPDQPAKPDTPAKGKGREEADPATRKPTDQPTAPTAREAREHRGRPAPPAPPAEETAKEGAPPIDMPVVPSEPLRPRGGRETARSRQH